MGRRFSPDDLWNAAPAGDRVFNPENLSQVPEIVRRYLEHSIARRTPLARTVRLRMHGELKLRRWHQFEAEQVISWGCGMIWRASVRMHRLAITGSDTFIKGEGIMRWKLFGLIPLVNASGSEITRSAAGRINLESIWLPSALVPPGITWQVKALFQFHASFTAHGEAAEIDYMVTDNGRLMTVNMPRWGNPEGGKFRYENCGALVEEERRFGGYTIPSHVRVGWHFGTDRFESEGEFFRARIDDAAYK